MKASRIHRVPLTRRALEILQTVAQFRPTTDGDDALVFPSSKRSRPLSDMTLSAGLRRHGGEGFAPHGFRSSFRDWAGDMTAFPREVAEAALAHAVGDATEAAYRRGALAKRRALMDAWGEFVAGSQGAVETTGPKLTTVTEAAT